MTATNSTTALAHPNIALIKYWGKSNSDLNLPSTPVSYTHLTLRQSHSRLVKGVSFKRNIALSSLKALTWAKEKVPYGLRTLLGILLMIGGVLGFLPILGFWMFPLGMAFIALDLPFTQKRIDHFIVQLQTIVKETEEF